MSSYKIINHEYDVVVLGAGGSGLRAAVGLSEEGLKTASISKVLLLKIILSILDVVIYDIFASFNKF